MKIDKIEILIKNKRHYADVALLVDKPDFIDWINDLRKKWKIEKTFSDSDYLTINSHIWKMGKQEARRNFKKDIEKIRIAYGRQPNFDEVILYALAFNEVPEGAYSSCYLKMIMDPEDPDDETKYKYAIIVTPNTTVGDIRKVLAKYKQKMKVLLNQNFEGKEVDLTKYEFGPKQTPSPKNINNIIRDREWYWLKKKGLSYGQIAKSNNKKISINGIIEAIKSYKFRLEKP